MQDTKCSLLGENQREQYAGMWVALDELGRVVSTARTCDVARALAGHDRELALWWVSPYSPHVMMPWWPLVPLKELTDPHSLWLVGGAVRDLLTNCRPHDWDFACRRDGLILARLAADVLGGSYYPLDPQRGTGRVIVRDPGTAVRVTIDIAELRGKGIKADLQKRDFTVNAMALTLHGELVDPLHGYEDLKHRYLRMTSPDAFTEDPVRIIRLARLASTLGYVVDDATLGQARHDAALVRDVAPERVRDELLRALSPRCAVAALNYLHDVDVPRYVLPEVAAVAGLESTVRVLQVLADLMCFVDRAPRRTKGIFDWSGLSSYNECVHKDMISPVSANIRRHDLLVWGGLFALLDEDERVKQHQVRGRLCALRFPRRACLYVEILAIEAWKLSAVLVSLRGADPGRREIYRFFQRTGDAGVGAVILALALSVSRGDLKVGWVAEEVSRAASVYLEAACHARSQIVEPPPLLTGRELMAMGVEEGPDVGKILARLRESQAAGEITTREGARGAVQRWLLELSVDDTSTSPDADSR